MGHGDYEEDDYMPPRFYTVGIALYDRAYGGPEEGGWWYDVFEPVIGGHVPALGDASFITFHMSNEAAQRRRVELDELIKKAGLNEGRPPVSSVLSRGQFIAFVWAEMPESLPKERPHYE